MEINGFIKTRNMVRLLSIWGVGEVSGYFEKISKIIVIVLNFTVIYVTLQHRLKSHYYTE
jgi:ABC-type nickel/cobalt efflux system permease component RcnA